MYWSKIKATSYLNLVACLKDVDNKVARLKNSNDPKERAASATIETKASAIKSAQLSKE